MGTALAGVESQQPPTTGEHGGDVETDIELGNGDSLAERLATVDLDVDATCAIEDLRERLGL